MTRTALLAALMAACVATAAPAQERAAQGQEPPPPNCVESTARFAPAKTYTFELTNRCERRVRCTVNAYIVTSFGPVSLKRTVVLAPASKGDKARRAIAVKLKEDGGTANASRACKVL